MRAVTLLTAVMILSGSSLALADCGCPEPFEYYPTDPRDLPFMEEFYWEVKGLEPIYDLRQIEEPIVSCLVGVGMVSEDNPAVEYLTLTGKDQILFFGTWMTFPEFETLVEDQACSMPVS